MKLVRESISFQRGKDPKTTLFDFTPVPGDLVLSQDRDHLYLYDEKDNNFYFYFLGIIYKNMFQLQEPNFSKYVYDSLDGIEIDKLKADELELVKPAILKYKDVIEKNTRVKIHI